MSRSLQFTVNGPIDTNILIEEVIGADGFVDLKVTVSADESGGLQADLRGIFFGVKHDGLLQHMSASGADVTDSQFEDDAVSDLGNGANIKGSLIKGKHAFDAGVEIGTQGIGNDDIDTTTFYLSRDGGDFTLDELGGERIAIRYTSFGSGDDRDGSLKIGGRIPHAPDAQDDAFTLDEDTVITGNLFADNGFGADTDKDSSFTVTDVTHVSGEGALTVNPDGSFTFIPGTSFIGPAVFEYTIDDGNGGQDCATATFTTQQVDGITATLAGGLAVAPGGYTLSADNGQIANVTRGPDGSVTFQLSVDVPDVPEVADIVLAQDLSGSFSNDLPNLKGSFVQTLLTDLETAGADDVGFGIASYVDYPVSPFGDASSGDYPYLTHLGVTTDAAAAQTVMNGLSTKYGGDGPEAQLIALQQVALRADTEIGFRDGAQRFVVLSTDAAFHQAGNYLAGGTNDNDSDLTDGTGAFGLEDYPAIAQVAAALAAADLTPIFAVTSGLTATYQNLLNVMNSVDPTIGGSVVTLSSDSSNLGSAIIAGLSEATTNVDIAVVGDDYGFITSVTPSSYTSVQGPDTVTFDVTMEEPASYGNDTVTLQVPNFGEVVLNFDFGTEDLVGTAGRDTLTGNNYANTISGLERADTISGMGGDDILIGGLGDDLLSGGLGNDTFVFENAVNFRGTDTVTDFVKGSDILQLSGYGAVAFGDLGLSDDGAGNAEVMVNDGAADDPIIVLLGVDFNTLDASDFTFV